MSGAPTRGRAPARQVRQGTIRSFAQGGVSDLPGEQPGLRNADGPPHVAARSAPFSMASRSFFSSDFCLATEWNFSPNMSLT